MCSRVRKGLLSSARCFVHRQLRGFDNNHRRSVRLGDHVPARPVCFPPNRRHISRTACVPNIKDLTGSSDKLSALNIELEEFSWRTAMTWECFENMQQSLYPNSADPLIISLAAADSLEEIFQSVGKTDLNEQQASQAIVSIWEVLNKQNRFTFKSFKDVERFLRRTKAIHNNPVFHSLIKKVNNSSHLLSDKELAYILLTLRRLDIPPWNPKIYKIFCLSLKHINQFSIHALAMWSLAVRDPITNGRLMIAPLLSAIESHMDSCKTVEDIDEISTCLLSASHLITPALYEKYAMLVERLLDAKILTNGAPILAVNKIAQTLYIANRIVTASRSLIRILELMEHSPELETCPTSVISNINKILKNLMEPIHLAYKTEDIAFRWLDKEQLSLEHVDYLACLSQHLPSNRKTQLELGLTQLLSKESIDNLFPMYRTIFGIIRRLRISNRKLVDLFWQSVMKCIDTSWNEQPQPNTLFYHVVGWYMFFNNNLGGTYRHLIFERQMLKWISEAWSNGSSASFSCRKYSQLAAFVVAYGSSGIPETVDRILQMEHQLTVRDIHILGRGVECSDTINGRTRPAVVSRSLIELSLLLDRRIKFWLEKNTLLPVTSTLLLSFSHRRRLQLYDSATIALAFQKCEEQLDQLNAGIIHHVAHCVEINKFLSEKTLDAIFSYVIQRHHHIPPPLQARVATLAMDVGYLPPSLDTLFPIVCETLLRERGRLSGLTILQSTLALLLQNHLSSQLVGTIFNADFIGNLDAEVANFYSKVSYPNLVRTALMELNRAVCIDMPEIGVPWFHDRYCQEQLEIQPPISTKFHADVEHCLIHLLGAEEYLKKFAVSPYFHLIDFQVLLDEDGNPVVQSDINSNDQHQKVAILLKTPNAFTFNVRNLRGLHMLHQRNLEILGYRVLAIPYYEWNSLSLSSLEAKCNYLSDHLFSLKNT